MGWVGELGRLSCSAYYIEGHAIKNGKKKKNGSDVEQAERG